MAKTRSMTRTKKSIYRARLKTSSCRGKKSNACKRKNGCKNTRKNIRKSYCRKAHNRSA